MCIFAVLVIVEESQQQSSQVKSIIEEQLAKLTCGGGTKDILSFVQDKIANCSDSVEKLISEIYVLKEKSEKVQLPFIFKSQSFKNCSVTVR